MVSLDCFDSAFYSILECPVCKEYMSPPPINMCINGHCICSKCTPKVVSCPTCRDDISEVRNIALEHIIEIVNFPCTNHEAGCNAKMQLADKEKHELFCNLRMYDCLPGKKDNCKWTGRKEHIVAHMEEKHSAKSWMKSSKLNVAYPEIAFDKDENDYQLIRAHDELFWFTTYMKSSESTLYIAVIYIGAKENASKYFYKIAFDSGNKSQYSIVFCTSVHFDYENIADLANTKKCFSIASEVAKNFTVNNMLKYGLEIIKSDN